MTPTHEEPEGPRRGGPRGEPAGARRPASYAMPEAEQILRRVIEIVESAPGMPMSASVRVNREELLELLDDAVERIPDEVRSARWLLKEREEFMARAQRDADELIAEARSRVAHMVQRTEVVKAAEARARAVVDEAEARARRMRREAEDYCDQKLASFENVLAKVAKAVAAGRSKLAAPSIEEAELGDLEEPTTGPSPAVFDQER